MTFRKAYISVTVRFDETGRVIPLRYQSEDGTVHCIESVTASRPAASIMVGGCGILFSCMVRRRPVNLFFEQGRWFYEAPQDRMNTDPSAYSWK